MRPTTLFAFALLLTVSSGCATVEGFVRRGGGGSVSTAGIAADLDRIFDDPATERGQWGVVVRSLSTGKTVYARNADRMFLPASNIKLLTGAAILETLTPEYRWTTSISTTGRVVNGVLQGSLVIKGTGDPTFSERFYPGDARTVFREWADSLRSRGIRRVSGGIIAVDSAFAGPIYGQGWMWDDLLTPSSAPYSALQFNDNVISVSLYPSSSEMQPGVVVVSPVTQAVRVLNDTRTLGAGNPNAVTLTRDENGTGIVVGGQIAIGSPEVRNTVAVSNPVTYFVTVLRETLREVGIDVEGAALMLSDLEPYDPLLRNAAPLFIHQSPPLAEVLPQMMKPSQNQIAELMFMTVGREIGENPTAEGATEVINDLLRSWSINPAGLRMVDGSGLSRYNLASPALLADVLAYMDKSHWREIWTASLPVSGRDGTLADRMHSPALIDRIQAKTGTVNSVRNLSGYLTAPSGERFVFSFLLNGSLAPASEVDRIVDTALYRLTLD
ncbi:MAG: D-alanyl-D-alanine carboxypeptidase/D-alanyl-D-alanine-endopeptidase [Gemmatimonadota bacterium]|jgi:D-alanyl-D-alanine carboxypeptidase/D-alanyl-D-alanine-endopeptidase (penicillin-binding protein 4)|nr:D-alanyl-D-alanine carboxypeptidase/D-alanyl-D-alanine-endopeptidase [Gemmatimonadota bacterium]